MQQRSVGAKSRGRPRRVEQVHCHNHAPPDFFLTSTFKKPPRNGYAAGKVAQAEVVFRLSPAIVVVCDNFLNIPIDIRRRDSARPAVRLFSLGAVRVAGTENQRAGESTVRRL